MANRLTVLLEKGKTIKELNNEIVEKVGKLAQRFGRRLYFTAVGIGDCNECEVLEKMVEASKDYWATPISHCHQCRLLRWATSLQAWQPPSRRHRQS
jgi:hypothetical protein